MNWIFFRFRQHLQQMHEFSLAQGLTRQLEDLARQHKAQKICTVRVAIGIRSGIVVDSFTFGFEVLAKEDTLLQEAILEISEPDGDDLILLQVEME